MRTNTLSIVVIALALLAIVGGFASGQAGSHPPSIGSARPQPLASVHALVGRSASDAAVEDIFADDDVDVERTDAVSTAWRPARLSIVVGLCGSSARIESAFLHAGLPLAFDLDPHAPEALAFARLARDAGAQVLVHVSSPPSAAVLVALRARYGDFDGVASRTSDGMPRALAGTGLTFFDERGDADPKPFAAAHVPFVARDATVDDRSAESYVAFMLARAAERSQHEAGVTVLMRPLPASLAALQEFEQTRSVQIAALRPDVH